jgi:alkylated DNA repair protein (DNA oxidative demethylase)
MTSGTPIFFNSSIIIAFYRIPPVTQLAYCRKLFYTHTLMHAPLRAPGLFYDPDFVTAKDRKDIVTWLSTIHPLWESRFSTQRALPEGETQRRLLRPVYWLGNWQFACLNYYRPPESVKDRCVRAEPFPPVLQRLIKKVESTAQHMFRGKDMPPGWHLNTCLVNLYGTCFDGDKKTDTARVGEHKDFEPGPVASISLGEKAMFQFVKSHGRNQPAKVVFQQWLDDGSLQLFGGDKWKNQLFHRVQRVESRGMHKFPPQIDGFETRRVNFTFRYVPKHHIIPFKTLPKVPSVDVLPYMKELARHSSFFKRELV